MIFDDFSMIFDDFCTKTEFWGAGGCREANFAPWVIANRLCECSRRFAPDARVSRCLGLRKPLKLREKRHRHPYVLTMRVGFWDPLAEYCSKWSFFWEISVFENFPKIYSRSLRECPDHPNRFLWCPWLAQSAVGHSSGPAGRCRGFPCPLEPTSRTSPGLAQIAKSLENLDFLRKTLFFLIFCLFYDISLHSLSFWAGFFVSFERV